MTVRELIAKLLELPLDVDVVISDADTGEYLNVDVGYAAPTTNYPELVKIRGSYNDEYKG